jgi:hypothetical protein
MDAHDTDAKYFGLTTGANGLPVNTLSLKKAKRFSSDTLQLSTQGSKARRLSEFGKQVQTPELSRFPGPVRKKLVELTPERVRTAQLRGRQGRKGCEFAV